jgi:hypothetical protein
MSSASAKKKDKEDAERAALWDLKKQIKLNEQVALKQLTTMHNDITLLKDTKFHNFERSLKNYALTFGWDEELLDIDEKVFLPSYRNDPDKLQKLNMDSRNLYTLLLSKVKGHDVECLIEECEIGNGRQIWLEINNHMRRKTRGGKNKATRGFTTAAMANTNTTIVQWCATVRRLARQVVEMGGEAGEEIQIQALMDGLLPQFGPILVIINASQTLSIKEIQNKLLDFAKSSNLEYVKKNTTKNYGVNTSNVGDGKFKGECFKWKENK